VTFLLAGVVGFALAMAAHDLAIQALDDDRSLRPFARTCPGCGDNRGWHRFRCDRCGRPIARELFVALGAALAAAGFINTIGPHWALLAYAGFLLLSSALLVSDLEAFRIVDRLNLPGSAVLAVSLVPVALADGSAQALLRGFLGAAAYFAGAFVLWLVVRGQGFGAGDVKLAPQLGLFTAYLSWGTLGWAVFATAILGGVFGLVMMLVGRAGMKTELPYGPPMILGAWSAIAGAGLMLPG
jgi:leader peptidase (prepilin peptidase) / N-methyltransferase